MPPFDPDAAASPDSGVFGLPFKRRESRVILIPVPWDATTSYGKGTSMGPGAIREASMQVDLFDRRLGKVYEQGIHMLDEVERLHEMNEEAGELADPIIAEGGATEDDAETLKKIEEASLEINRYVEAESAKALREGKVPGVVGGEHSVPFGSIKACAEHVAGKGIATGLGILHVDAHMDFRDAFEGFAWSHASIMRNVLTRVPGVTKLVQVGIRDFGAGELAFAKEQGDRVAVHFDDDWAERQMRGERWHDLCQKAIEPLPPQVYVSFDIDALDPSLCPYTGTPVPGGLSFHQACILLELLRASGREVVGFDLVEVAPGPEGVSPIDSVVGARLLYKLCGVVMPKA